MKTYIAFLAMLIPCLLFGQTVERTVISSLGTATVSGTGMQVSQTVGEPMVKSFSPGALIVSEGFQQGSSTSVGNNESLAQNVSYTIFPNPVGNLLNVRIESANPLNLELSFCDLLGHATAIPTRKVTVDGSLTETIDCSGLAQSTYLLILRDTETGSVKTLQVRKVE